MKFSYLMLFGLVVNLLTLVVYGDFTFRMNSESCPSGYAEAILFQFNRQRSNNGYPPLQLNDAHSLAAQQLTKRNRCEQCAYILDRYSPYGQQFFALSQEAYASYFTNSIASEMENINARGRPVYTGDGKGVEYTKSQWAAVRQMGVACAMYNFPLSSGKPCSILKIVYTFDKPENPVPSKKGAFSFPVKKDGCPPGFPQAMMEAFNGKRSQEGITKPMRLDAELSHAAQKNTLYYQNDTSFFILGSYVPYGQHYYTLILEIVTNRISYPDKWTYVPWIMDNIMGRGYPVYTGNGNKVPYTKQQWAAVGAMGVGCATYNPTLRNGKDGTMLKVLFTFEKPINESDVTPITPVPTFPPTPEPMLTTEHMEQTTKPTVKPDPSEGYHFLPQSTKCPTGFPMAMLNLFNEKRSKNNMKKLHLSDFATGIAKVIGWQRDCRRKLEWNNSQCQLPEDRKLEKYDTYGQIYAIIDLSTGTRKTAKEIMANRQVSANKPIYLKQKDGAMAQFTENEWADSSQMGIACWTNLDDANKDVQISFVFNGASTNVRPPPTPLKYNRINEYGVNFTFPIQNEACPAGFDEIMLTSLNEKRHQEGIDKPLVLNPTLNSEARMILSQTRCQDCPFLKKDYKPFGQNYYSIAQTSKSTTQFDVNSVRILRSFQRRNGGRPMYTGNGRKENYSTQQWAQVGQMGMACATYQYSIDGAETISALKIIFTFDPHTTMQEQNSNSRLEPSFE